MKTIAPLYLLFIVFLLEPQDIYCQLYRLNTERLNLIYIDKGYSYMVPHAARTFENALNFHTEFWNYTPSEEVTILLNDFKDFGSAGTITIPWNFLTLEIAPFEYNFDVMPANERMQWLMNHELAHIVMTDKASSSDRFYRNLFFGKVLPDAVNPASMIYSYLTTPRWYSPRWFHEGIAVFMETWMSGGLGRVLSGYDEMVFRAMVKDDAYFYRVVGLETEGTTIDFQVGVNSYLYGTRFMSYLAHTYGVEKLISFCSRSDSSSRFYAAQFENVYGIPIEDEWENWISREKEFQKENLERINKYPLTKTKRITSYPLGSVSSGIYDSETRRFIAAVNYPGRLAHVSSFNIDTGEEEIITNVKSPMLYAVTSLAYDNAENKLFLSTQNQDWRGLDLVDMKESKETELIKYTRAGDLVFNRADKSLWGIQTLNGRSKLVRFNPPYKSWDDVYLIPFGKSLFDIDISSDGKYLSGTLSDAAGKQTLVIFSTDSLMQTSASYTEIYEFEDNSALNFTFSIDNKYLIGTSYYTGVSNVYRVNIETKTAELLTNTDIGFFRPVQIAEDTLLVYEYTVKGLQPCLVKIAPLHDAEAIVYLGQQVKEGNNVVEDWMLPPPSVINIDSLTLFEGSYNEFTEIKMASAYPIVEGYKDFISYGYKVNLLDHLGLHSLSLAASYSPVKLIPHKERVHLSLDYKYWDWEFKAGLNKADFYDIFGPTKYSRAGYYYSLQYEHEFIFTKPENLSISLRAAAYGDLEKLPGYQNINVLFDKLYNASFNFNYSYLLKSLGAVEEEEGIDFNFYSDNNVANDKIFPKLYFSFDKGFLLPVRNSSVWIRTSAGHSFGEKDNPFTNFYFGGFGNNYVDHLTAQRYRKIESFPGAEINEIGGRNYGKITLEWNLPPLRFRHLGFLSFYSTFARLSLFASALAVNLEESNGNKFLSTGSQLDFELVLFSLLKSTLSFGYGRAFGKNIRPSDEFMISLKLM